MSTSHACHLPGCGSATPRRRLFCPTHWSRVSAATKARVLAAYRATRRGTSGQIIEFASAEHRREYVEAAKQAKLEASGIEQARR